MTHATKMKNPEFRFKMSRYPPNGVSPQGLGECHVRHSFQVFSTDGGHDEGDDWLFYANDGQPRLLLNILRNHSFALLIKRFLRFFPFFRFSRFSRFFR